MQFEDEMRQVPSQPHILVNSDGSKVWSTKLQRFLKRNNSTAGYAPFYREVCEAWNGPPPEPIYTTKTGRSARYEVNHKDGNKLNCHYSNLEWCTSSENKLHAWGNHLVDREKHATSQKARHADPLKKEAHRAAVSAALLSPEINQRLNDALHRPEVILKRRALTFEQAEEIRTSNTHLEVLAETYGVSLSSVYRARRGEHPSQLRLHGV